MFENFSGIFVLAFSLGLIHALDADHILAVSSMSSARAGVGKSLRYAWKWSVGHGAILLLMVIILKSLNLVLPPAISSIAEQVVGLVLIILGLLVLYQLKSKHLHIHFHKHDGLHLHAHWHDHDKKDVQKINHRHDHHAYLIGGLHGLAGSAPLLALIPVVKSGQLSLSIAYILFFSLGVFVAMQSFGWVLGSTLQKLTAFSMKYSAVFKSLIALLTMGIGVHLVAG